MRNSLSPISMGIDLLLSPDGENTATLLSMLRSSCNSLSHILDDVLSMQKIEEGKYVIEPSFFNINDELEVILSQYGVQCSVKGVSLISEYAKEPSVM